MQDERTNVEVDAWDDGEWDAANASTLEAQLAPLDFHHTITSQSPDDCPICGKRITDTDDAGCEAPNGQRWRLAHFVVTDDTDSELVDFARTIAVFVAHNLQGNGYDFAEFLADAPGGTYAEFVAFMDDHNAARCQS